MAISASAVWELRTTATASNVNGGFFVTGASGTDYSQQDAAQYNLTGVTTAGADAILLTASAAADMVGNAAHIISGTNFTAGRYEILSVVAGVSITLDRTCTTGAGSVGVVNIGGAIPLGAANDDAVFENAVAGQTFYVKQGTYTLGGTVSISAAGSSTVMINVEGYAVTRGDRPTGATRPTLTIAATAITFGANWRVRNMIFTSSSNPTATVTLGAANVFIDCKSSLIGAAADRTAYYMNADSVMLRCEGVNTTGRGVNSDGSVTILGCLFDGCKVGLNLGGTTGYQSVIGCLITNPTSAAVTMSQASTSSSLFMNNTFYGASTPAGTGISITGASTDVRVINNVIYGFTTGVSHGTAGQTVGVDMYNAYYNNTTNGTNWSLGTGSTTTALTFVNIASGNFTLASGGSSGFPSAFPGGLTTDYGSIGAVQAAASGGGGATRHLGPIKF